MDSYIAFPKLGIRFDDVNRFLQIGDFKIAWYGIIICAGMLLCVFLGMKNCRRANLTTDRLLDYLLVAIPSAIVGARLYYVLFSLESYKDDLLSIFYVWEGGLAIYGGLIGAALGIIIMSLIRKDNILVLLDFAFPYIFLGQAIGRWGNFINQEAFGVTTKLPWGMTGDSIDSFVVQNLGEPSGSLVHPTFLYESLWCFAGFIVLTIFYRKFKKGNGEVLALYFLIYGLERAFVEGIRIDSLMVGGVRISQLISIGIAVISIPFFIDCRKRYKAKEALSGDGEVVTTSLTKIVAENIEAEDDETASDDNVEIENKTEEET